MDRMIENARLMGANAIIGMRFDSSEIGETLTEIVAYGTAVVVTADGSCGCGSIRPTAPATTCPTRAGDARSSPSVTRPSRG